MNTSALAGRRIVVTRALRQAAPLAEAIVKLGGLVVSLPLLEIRDASDGGAELRERLALLGPKDWLVVLSPNGASRIVGHVQPGTCKLAVVASGTASVFRDAGWVVDLLPETASSSGLLAAFQDVTIDGQVLIAQAEGGRENLLDGLRARAIDVRSVVAYRNLAPVVEASAVNAACAGDTVVFASPSAVVRYVETVGVVPIDAVCIGSVTAASARNAGFSVTEACAPTTAALIDALV